MFDWKIVGTVALLASCKAPAPADDPAGPGPNDTPVPPEPTVPEDVDLDDDGFDAAIDCDDDDAAVHAKVTVDDERYYANLTNALAEATAGADIVVCAGTYTGEHFATVPVTLRSIDGAETTYLSGNGATRVLALPGGSTVTGFTIADGQADEGGGIRQTSPEPLTIDSCVVSSNRARIGGGISVPAGGTLVLVATEVTGNGAEGGGGITVGAGGRLELVDSTVADNVATHWGGGVHLDGADLVGGEITGNRATDEWWPGPARGGGGVSSVGTSTITDTVLTENEAWHGGGFSIIGGELTLTDVTVHQNHAVDLPGSSSEGGGGMVDLATLRLLGTTRISENTSVGAAGGLGVYDSVVEGGIVEGNEARWGGGLSTEDARIDGMTVTNNIATDGDGGGIQAGSGSEIVGCTVTANHADAGDGGGISALNYQPEVFVTDTVVSGNSASRGGGIASGYLGITGGSITDNVAREGGGLYLTYCEYASETLGTAYVLTGVEIARNTASNHGGGVAMNNWEYGYGEPSGTLVSESSDWGDGADDNQPGDVSYVWYGSVGNSPEEVAFGADASFSCTDEGCVP